MDLLMMEKTEFDARFRELGPIIYYGPLYDKVELTLYGQAELCILSKRPNDKVYAFCEAMIGSGELKLSPLHS